ESERDEAIFEFARLKSGADQDRDFAERVSPAVQGLDLVADPAGFLLGIPHRPHDHFLAFVRLRPQGLPEAAAVLCDHSPCCAEDVRRRAVILFEPGDRRTGEIVLEAQDVADLSAAPTVNRLVVVADATQIAAFLRQQTQPQILSDVGVLVLVDEQVTEALLVFSEDVGIPGEEAQIVQQKVAEIDGVHGYQALLVLAVQIDPPTSRETIGVAGRNLFGSKAAILPALDLRQQEAGGPAPLVDVLCLNDLFQEPDLIVGIEDREAGFEPYRLGMPAQNARGNCMKGAEPDALGGAADHSLEPLAHLA